MPADDAIAAIIAELKGLRTRVAHLERLEPVVAYGSGQASFYLYNAASTDLAGYKKLLPTHSAAAEAPVAVAITGADIAIEEWATEVGEPNQDFLLDGIVHVHLHAAKTGGVRDAYIYAKVYGRTSGGTETLLATTENSDLVPAGATAIDLEIAISYVDLAVTDRLVVKVLGTRVGTGTNPTITLYYEGTTSARVDVPVAAGVGHQPVTLDANSVQVNSLTGQELGLQVQPHNFPWIGPETGAPAIPTFRALVTADIPAQISTTKSYIGDNANAKMTVGLTINQGAAVDEMAAFKNTGATAHGMTSITEADTFGTVKIANATYGALDIAGLGTGSVGLFLQGLGQTDDTNKDASANAAIVVDAWQKSGTGQGNLGANANLFAVRMAGSARFIVDEDGDYLYDGAGTGYDDHDDLALLEALDTTLTDALRADWDEWTARNRQTLEAAGIIHYNADGRHFVSGKRLARLLVGALRQMATRTSALEAIVERLQLAAP